MKLTLEINETAWQFAADKANAAKLVAHNSTEASKPEKDRAAFVPVTLEEYVAARVMDVEASYESQRISELHQSALAAATALPPEKQAEVLALIQKLSA